MIRLVRLLHLVAIACLVGSAVYAYSIKYETLLQAEQVTKLKAKLHREHEAIAVLRAEWQLLTKPDRLQAAVSRHLPELEPVGVQHMARASELPARNERGDEIGRKLEALGLGPTATPREASAAATTGSTGSTGARAPAAASGRTPAARPVARTVVNAVATR